MSLVMIWYFLIVAFADLSRESDKGIKLKRQLCETILLKKDEPQSCDQFLWISEFFDLEYVEIMILEFLTEDLLYLFSIQLKEVTEELGNQPVIIWCCFKYEIEKIKLDKETLKIMH